MKIWQVPWFPCKENAYITIVLPKELEITTVQNHFYDNKRGWDIDILHYICNERDMELIKKNNTHGT